MSGVQMDYDALREAIVDIQGVPLVEQINEITLPLIENTVRAFARGAVAGVILEREENGLPATDALTQAETHRLLMSVALLAIKIGRSYELKVAGEGWQSRPIGIN